METARHPNLDPEIALSAHSQPHETGPDSRGTKRFGQQCIEVFFKTLKQNLRVKTFLGTTENALRIQIWSALIALLLIQWLHYLSKAGWSLSNLATMVRLNLFTYRDLGEWLNDPLHTPPIEPPPEQMELNLR